MNNYCVDIDRNVHSHGLLIYDDYARGNEYHQEGQFVLLCQKIIHASSVFTIALKVKFLECYTTWHVTGIIFQQNKRNKSVCHNKNITNS